MGTTWTGRPTASACASSRLRRTACMATRSWASLTVVSRATTCMSPRPRRTCRAQALSLPLLQARTTFTSGAGAEAQPRPHRAAEGGVAERLLVLAIEEVLAGHERLQPPADADLRARVQPCIALVVGQAEAEEVAVHPRAHEDERSPRAEPAVPAVGGEGALVAGTPDQRLALRVDGVEVARARLHHAVGEGVLRGQGQGGDGGGVER